jgi:HEPN domain-containing protein
MSNEEIEPGSPKDWLRHAFSDLELAHIAPNEKILLEDLCFHAQQASEKALKAVLVANGIPYPKTHNIRTLLELLPQDVTPSQEIQGASILTDYAVISRYPGDFEPVTEDEHQEAFRLAEAVVKWAEGIIKGMKRV